MLFLFLPVYSYLATKFDAIDSLSGKELIVESKEQQSEIFWNQCFSTKTTDQKISAPYSFHRKKITDQEKSMYFSGYVMYENS